MKARFGLLISFSQDGQPLPMLEMYIGKDRYIIFDGQPIPDWRQGSVTRRSTEIELHDVCTGDEQP